MAGIYNINEVAIGPAVSDWVLVAKGRVRVLVGIRGYLELTTMLC